MSETIDPTAKILRSEICAGAQIREFCTIRDSFIGYRCKIYERVSVKKSTIGAGSDINAGTYIENAEIGIDVQIAPNCSIAGVTHDFSIHGVSHSDIFKRIYIDDGAWIGAGSIILPGIKIGKGAVIGAGSVVNKDVPDRYVFVGNPLKCRLYAVD